MFPITPCAPMMFKTTPFSASSCNSATSYLTCHIFCRILYLYFDEIGYGKMGNLGDRVIRSIVIWNYLEISDLFAYGEGV